MMNGISVVYQSWSVVKAYCNCILNGGLYGDCVSMVHLHWLMVGANGIYVIVNCGLYGEWCFHGRPTLVNGGG